MSAGDASPASGADRFFFALQPDEYAASQADRFRQRLGQELGLAGTPVRPEHLHVGLLPLSGMPVLPAQAVARAAEVISSLRVAPFEVEFDEVACQAIGLECDQALVLVGNRGSGQMVTLQRQLAQDAVNVYIFNPTQVVVAKKGLKGLWNHSPIFANDLAALRWE